MIGDTIDPEARGGERRLNPVAYDDDIVTWSEEQARALRAAGHAGANLPIDREHVAEEVEALGKNQARELASRIATLLLHLMRLEASPAIELRAGWRDTVQEQRNEIERLLADAPSLRPAIAPVIGKETGKAGNRAAIALASYGEKPRAVLDSIGYSEDQVLGGWFPEEGSCPA